ncbi:uncharacterized protein LOC141709057 [Apium graveolens]|uniref:uncharacterized protein LOC141709057 n=1 Tax=Apium graveolens TaxID=4045 RepID=UPI003D79662F
MKPENLILSTLIPGPVYPGNEIDVYMQPLIAELKELWAVGIETYDASKKVVYLNHQKFLPPVHKWRSDRRRFNGDVEMLSCPDILSGAEVEELLRGYENDFGKPLKRNRGTSDCPWKKKSIFFELPYWSNNMVRHNLDVMHIEKNICDKILGTLLNIGGKIKDHLNARQDLEEMGIRKDLHPVKCDDKHVEIRASSFDMTKKEKEIFCSVLMNAKLPYRSASNISRCVQMKERKVSGYKSHDAHFILQFLLQFAVVKTLKPEVAIPLMRLGAFFRGICGKVIELEDVEKLQKEIIEILCELEMIFPPAFFDIMVHLPIHLCKEIEFGGPVHLRWMFGIERYLCKLKSYVRNRSKPEGCVAEGYLVEECLTFCSRFFDEQSKSGTDTRDSHTDGGYPIGSRRSREGKSIHLDNKTWTNAHRYLLFNCENVEIEKLKDEHHTLVQKDDKLKRYKRERMHTTDFQKWLKYVVQKRDGISLELSSLARGPLRSAKRFTGYNVNGYRFHNKLRDSRCTMQNSGVFLTALTTSFASAKDKNPIVGDVGYYGAIEEIIEVDYWGAVSVVLFRCCWYPKAEDYYGLAKVNFSRLCQKEDPFVLATQVQQFFYIEDPTEKNLQFVLQKYPKDQYSEVEEVSDIGYIPRVDIPDTFTWSRDDVPKKQFPVTPNEDLDDIDI